MPPKVPSPVHRIGLSEDEINDLIITLDQLSITAVLAPDTLSAYKKLQVTHAKINIGVKAPAYSPTGRSSNEGRKLSDKMGISPEELYLASLSMEEKLELEFEAAEYNVMQVNDKDVKPLEYFARKRMDQMAGIAETKSINKPAISINDSDSDSDSQLGSLFSQL